MTTVALAHAAWTPEEAGEDEPPDEPPEREPSLRKDDDQFIKKHAQNPASSRGKEATVPDGSDLARAPSLSDPASLRLRRSVTELEVHIPAKNLSAPIDIPGATNGKKSDFPAPAKTPEQRRHESSLNFLSSISLQAPTYDGQKLHESPTPFRKRRSTRKSDVASSLEPPPSQEASSTASSFDISFDPASPSKAPKSTTKSTPTLSPEPSPKEYSSSVAFLSNIALEAPQLSAPRNAGSRKLLSSLPNAASSSSSASNAILNPRRRRSSFSAGDDRGSLHAEAGQAADEPPTLQVQHSLDFLSSISLGAPTLKRSVTLGTKEMSTSVGSSTSTEMAQTPPASMLAGNKVFSASAGGLSTPSARASGGASVGGSTSKGAGAGRKLARCFVLVRKQRRGTKSGHGEGHGGRSASSSIGSVDHVLVQDLGKAMEAAGLGGGEEGLRRVPSGELRSPLKKGKGGSSRDHEGGEPGRRKGGGEGSGEGEAEAGVLVGRSQAYLQPTYGPHLVDSRLYLCPVGAGEGEEEAAGEGGRRGLPAPMGVVSVIKFRPKQDGASGGGEGAKAVVHSVETERRMQHGSYAELLNGKKDDSSGDEAEEAYDPYFLDDPEIKISKDRTVIKQEGYVVSCIPFVKPKLMKEELNGLFLAKHGDWLEGRDITLSKIRALKQDMVEVVLGLGLELSTAALAHVYLEKLILRNLVRKVSRKVTAAVCLLLAFKFNEVPRDPNAAAPPPRRSTLFVAHRNDASLPLPPDLPQFLDRFKASASAPASGQAAECSSPKLTRKTFAIIPFRDPATAAAARDAINNKFHVGRPDGRAPLIADFVPDPSSRPREGKQQQACSVQELLGAMRSTLGADGKAVLAQEFATFVDLGMSLHAKTDELLPHLFRILQALEDAGQDTLVSTMNEAVSEARLSLIVGHANEAQEIDAEEQERLRIIASSV